MFFFLKEKRKISSGRRPGNNVKPHLRGTQGPVRWGYEYLCFQRCKRESRFLNCDEYIPNGPQNANPRCGLMPILQRFLFEKILTGLEHAPIFSNKNSCKMGIRPQR